jgi:hypothetical protein
LAKFDNLAWKNLFIHLKYIQLSEVEDKRVNLQPQFDAVHTIPGNHNYHAFIPITGTSLVVRKHSSTLYKWTNCEYKTFPSAQ